MAPFKSAQFYDPIYGANYVVLVGDPKRAERWLRSRPRFASISMKGTELAHEGWASKCESDGYHYVVIWLRTLGKEQISQLTHELFHAMLYTFRRIGQKVGKHSEEASAYYLQWLVEEALKRL